MAECFILFTLSNKTHCRKILGFKVPWTNLKKLRIVNCRVRKIKWKKRVLKHQICNFKWKINFFYNKKFNVVNHTRWSRKQKIIFCFEKAIIKHFKYTDNLNLYHFDPICLYITVLVAAIAKSSNESVI